MSGKSKQDRLEIRKIIKGHLDRIQPDDIKMESPSFHFDFEMVRKIAYQYPSNLCWVYYNDLFGSIAKNYVKSEFCRYCVQLYHERRAGFSQKMQVLNAEINDSFGSITELLDRERAFLGKQINQIGLDIENKEKIQRESLENMENDTEKLIDLIVFMIGKDYTDMEMIKTCTKVHMVSDEEE